MTSRPSLEASKNLLLNSSPVSQSADIYGVEAKTGMLNLEMNRFQTLETKEKELEGCAINIKIRKFNAVKRGGKRFLEKKHHRCAASSLASNQLSLRLFLHRINCLERVRGKHPGRERFEAQGLIQLLTQFFGSA